MTDLVFKHITGTEGPDFIKEKKDLVLLDVRQPHEYQQAHIPESILIPLDELYERIDELDRDKEILVICRSGRRSVFACHILNENGFNKLFNLYGGIIGWTGAVESN